MGSHPSPKRRLSMEYWAWLCQFWRKAVTSPSSTSWCHGFFKDLRNDVGNIGWFGCQMGGRGTVKESLPLVWKVTETGWCLVMSKWPRWWYPRVVVFLPRKLVKWSNWTYTYFSTGWFNQPPTGDLTIWRFGVSSEVSPWDGNFPQISRNCPPKINGSKGSSLLSNQHFFSGFWYYLPWKTTNIPWKLMVFADIRLSWNRFRPIFRGELLNFRSVCFFDMDIRN